MRVDAIRRSAESHLAKSNEIARPEKVRHCELRLVRDVDLALIEPDQQFVHGQIHQLDLVGAVENGIRDGLAYRYAGHLRDEVIEAVKMLNIEGCIDRDARFDKFHHVLPALDMAGTGRIGVREFVHQ